jgi:ADP-ribosylglycohydrolase
MNEHFYYTFLAGWCAESVGAMLEFKKTRFTTNDVIDTMHFQGRYNDEPIKGQITDDTEMELCMLEALIEGYHDEYFPSDRIATKYIEWYKSNPADIGQTVEFALLGATEEIDVISNVEEHNEWSESNGSLMRCIPLAVFGVIKGEDKLFSMCETETKLTHHSSIVSTITLIYCTVIARILRCKMNNEAINVPAIFETIETLLDSPKLKGWYEEALHLTNLLKYDAIKNEGHVKHAFIFFIYFLNNIHLYSYERAIQEVLKCGGDTDTNAKIIGNLFGAYYGNCVLVYMSEQLLNFDNINAEHKFFHRPEKYGVKYGVSLIERLSDLSK